VGTSSIVVIALVVLLLALLVWVVVTYNALVRLRNKLQEAWAGIDVQLQRRADLVPTLVATVRAYADHEEDVLGTVADACARILAARGPRAAGDADEALEGALKQLFAVAEAYPDLRASENFLQLQHDLVALEEEISFARRYYNATVEDLNTRIQTIPTVLIARPLGFREAEYFKADVDDRAVPAVGLGS